MRGMHQAEAESCHTCHTVTDSRRRASSELHQEAQWQETDVISGLHSRQHVSANDGRYAGLPFLWPAGMCRSLHCRRGFTGDQEIKPTSFQRIWMAEWWKPRPQWNLGPRSLNRRGSCPLNHTKSSQAAAMVHPSTSAAAHCTSPRTSEGENI